MPSYDSYINSIGVSTTSVDPHDNWADYFGIKRQKTDPAKTYAEGKTARPGHSYMDAAPVVTVRPAHEQMIAQTQFTAGQNRIAEQQKRWNEAWMKRVSSMEDEEVELPKNKVEEKIQKQEETKTDEVKQEVVVSQPLVDDENVEQQQEPEVEQPVNFGYPHQEEIDGVYGAGAEMSDEDFVAMVENLENEPEESEMQFGAASVEQPEVEENVTEEPVIEDDTLQVFNEPQTFNHFEQPQIDEQNLFFDDDDDLIDVSEPATVEDATVVFSDNDDDIIGGEYINNEPVKEPESVVEEKAEVEEPVKKKAGRPKKTEVTEEKKPAKKTTKTKAKTKKK